MTLIELLIVLAIIALIAAISIGSLMVLPEHARVRATEALIAKLDSQLTQRLNAFNAQRQTISAITVDTATAGGEPNRAQIIAQKRAMRQQFPEWFVVINCPTPLVVAQWDPLVGQTNDQMPPAALVYRQVMDRAILGGSICNHSPATARAECLYMILTAAGAGGSGVDAEAFQPGEIADTDEDGLPEFVDKWGNPIEFFLWPTHYTSPTQRPGSEVDPADPNQLLTQADWWGTPPSGSPGKQMFELLYHSLTFSDNKSPPTIFASGFKTYPLIISAGPDQGFGLLSAGPGNDGLMGTLDDPAYPGNGPFLDSRAIRIPNSTQDGYSMDKDNVDNHHLRAR